MFDDAPLDQAVEGIVNGIYFNQGEVCCAGSRLLAQESIVEPLIEKLKDRLSTIRVGDPLDKNTDVGRDQLAGAAREDHRARGRRARPRARRCTSPPAICPSAASSSARRCSRTSRSRHRIAREEIFGPVLSVLTFRTPEEAVEKANNTPYGLSAGIWTDKGSRILHMVKRMKAGVVWANTFNRFDPTSPFGGYKESGFGREGGMHGLHAYVRLEDRVTGDRAGDAQPRADRRPQDVQALHRRGVPALRERAVVRRLGRRRRRRSRTPAGRRARTSATPSGPPARRSSRGPTRRR